MGRPCRCRGAPPAIVFRRAVAATVFRWSGQGIIDLQRVRVHATVSLPVSEARRGFGSARDFSQKVSEGVAKFARPPVPFGRAMWIGECQVSCKKALPLGRRAGERALRYLAIPTSSARRLRRHAAYRSSATRLRGRMAVIAEVGYARSCGPGNRVSRSVWKSPIQLGRLRPWSRRGE